MSANRFNLEAFARDDDAFARLALASDLFSLLTRQVMIPHSCTALVWGGASQPTVALGGDEIIADSAREVLFVKSSPIALAYELPGLHSSDGFEVSARIEFSVQAVPQREELELVRQIVLGSRDRAAADQLKQRCEETVRSAAAAFTVARTAEEILSVKSTDEFDGELARRFKPLGFASGIALCRDVRFIPASAGYAELRRLQENQSLRSRQREAEDSLRDAAREARGKHLGEIAAMLDQARALAEKNPGVSLTSLIQSFGTAQRGELYRGLLAPREGAARTKAVLIVAGGELVRLDPANPSRPSMRQSLPENIGPLRSVRVCRDGLQTLLLVGARRGVHVIDSEEGLRQTYQFEPPRELRGGVNAAVLHKGRLYATHSEVGLMRWEWIKPDAHEICLSSLTADAKAVRDIQFDSHGRLWFSADRKAIGWLPDDPAEPIALSAPAPIQTLTTGDHHVYAGLDDGSVVRWSEGMPSCDIVRPRGGTGVQSLEWHESGGVPRLLIADGRPLVSLHVLADSYHAEYRWIQSLRWATGSDDLVAAVNEIRDQVILWSLESPEEPLATVSIGRLCGELVQDIALLV